MIHSILSKRCNKEGFKTPYWAVSCLRLRPLFLRFVHAGKSLSHHFQLHLYCHLCGRDDSQGTSLSIHLSLYYCQCRPHTQTFFVGVGVGVYVRASVSSYVFWFVCLCESLQCSHSLSSSLSFFRSNSHVPLENGAIKQCH